MIHTYLDTETYEWNKKEECYEEVLNAQKFYYGDIKYQGKHKFFKTKEEMCEEVQNMLNIPNNHIWAYNHSYDFYAYTFGNLQEFVKNPDLKIIRMQPLMILNIKNGAKLIDLCAYYRGALETHGKAIGMPKLGRMPKVTKREELKEYLQRDVDMLEKLVELLIETYKFTGYNPRKLLTGAKSGMGRFLSKINKEPYAGYIFKGGAIHKNPKTIDFLRQASKGGRSEVFNHPKGKNCTYYDINSFYWEIMKTLKFPDLLKEVHFNKEMCTILPIDAILKKEGISHATIKIDVDLPLGLLAVRYTPLKSKRYKLTFPKKKGTIIKGYWTHSELNFAKENGYKILNIHECVRYSKNLKTNPFDKYITELYNYRLEKIKEDTPKSKLQAKLIKQMGTSLYGKFIQQQEEKLYDWIKREDKQEKEEEGWKVVGEKGDYCISKSTQDYIPPYQSIILGSLISAKARIELTKLLLEIMLENPDWVAYTDTDGIIILDEYGKPEKIIVGNELGQFKIQDQGKTYIYKPKTYAIGKTLAIAGIPTRNHKIEFFTKGEHLKRNTMTPLNIKNPDYKNIGTTKEEKIKPSYQEELELPMYIEEYIR